ncbi:hypothetical protein JQ604_22190 [Bradyrhizobium jicamae]|uniref:hypothetical protein n=1 Tax=Bradyrhizobium jicamae TaxID=280332 RepID=UPI001BA85F65|nr:hypothetical protein [Bradyrhizobium jicamae]MBR0754902.1 hypothetical protein [Bradyrhizobium jicamae]
MQTINRTNSEIHALTDADLDAVDGAGIISFLRHLFGGDDKTGGDRRRPLDQVDSNRTH